MVAQPPGAMAPLCRRMSRTSPGQGARPGLWLPAQGSFPPLEGVLRSSHKWATWKREERPQPTIGVGIEKTYWVGKAEPGSKGKVCGYVKTGGRVCKAMTQCPALSCRQGVHIKLRERERTEVTQELQEPREQWVTPPENKALPPIRTWGC